MPISTGPAQKILNGIFGGYLPQNYFIQIFFNSLIGPFAFTVVYDFMECLCMKMCACVHTFLCNFLRLFLFVFFFGFILFNFIIII